MEPIPNVEKECQLEKFPGKGGWTYIPIPEIPQDSHTPFGWVTVSGTIDDYPINKVKLMPFGNGSLFLPVKATIRKALKKSAGDQVKLILYRDDSPPEIPKELQECFENEPPIVLSRFNGLPKWQQKTYLDWIYSAKSDETKAGRIVKMLNDLQQ